MCTPSINIGCLLSRFDGDRKNFRRVELLFDGMSWRHCLNFHKFLAWHESSPKESGKFTTLPKPSQYHCKSNYIGFDYARHKTFPLFHLLYNNLKAIKFQTSTLSPPQLLQLLQNILNVWFAWRISKLIEVFSNSSQCCMIHFLFRIYFKYSSIIHQKKKNWTEIENACHAKQTEKFMEYSECFCHSVLQSFSK